MLRSRQRGGITVEAAITSLVFIVLLLGIMELSVFVYRLSSLADATRAGARFLSVNAPVDTLPEVCNVGEVVLSGNCGEDGPVCDAMHELMQRRMESLQPENIFYQYNCASTGFDDSYFQIYSIDVWVEGIEYGFLTPGLAQFQLEMPEFRATRLSEDLETVE